MQLWAERGFHGSGIRDLAQAAELSSATLYHYMGTKEDLLAEIMSDSMTRLITAASQVTDSPGSHSQRLSALVQLHVLAHAVRPQETRVVDGELRGLTAAHLASVLALRDRYEAIWQSVIDAGCAAGEFTVTSRSVARLALLQMCSGVALWYSPDGPLSLADLALRHAEMALSMLNAKSPVEDVVAECRALLADWP